MTESGLQVVNFDFDFMVLGNTRDEQHGAKRSRPDLHALETMRQVIAQTE